MPSSPIIWEKSSPIARVALVITGSSLAGLGVLTLFAAGITWLTAAVTVGVQVLLDDAVVPESEVQLTLPPGRYYRSTLRDREESSGYGIALHRGGIELPAQG